MKVARSLEETFGVFEDPHNLSRITPPWLNFKVLHGKLTMRPGLTIDYSIRWLGIGMRWRTLITAYDRPFAFTDFQERGPYRLWHHVHRFTPIEGATLVSDEVTYVPPLGWVGRLAHACAVKRQLVGIFRYRQTALAAILGGVTETGEPRVEPGLSISKQELANYRAQH